MSGGEELLGRHNNQPSDGDFQRDRRRRDAIASELGLVEHHQGLRLKLEFTQQQNDEESGHEMDWGNL